MPRHGVPLVLVLAAACAPTVTFIPTNQSPHALTGRSVSEVEVFTSALPTRPYVEVGIVTAETSLSYGAPDNSTAELIAAVRQKAAQAGCDAILMGPASAITYQATCIAYRYLRGTVIANELRRVTSALRSRFGNGAKEAKLRTQSERDSARGCKPGLHVRGGGSRSA